MRRPLGGRHMSEDAIDAKNSIMTILSKHTHTGQANTDEVIC